ncbi:MAG: hypothetical protein HRU18_08990 [Pseudoalteromonas sp.]|uniref:hypothetical protein n=1 Tax=Pseudoalteromonas sp. TaxID=53249 RepID=UPI001D3145AE|nr:hypothetical protein [Pseudoalteromonas sp.]NRA78333.1 hypothetical protein [Pseudoalteromonas sp.]
MKTAPADIFNKIETWLSDIAATEIGFYQYPRSVKNTTITVQPSEVGSSKREGEIQVLIIITVDSKRATSAIDLIEIVQRVQNIFISAQKINNNLDGLCKEVTEIDNAKIIAPDPNQGTAQAVLNFKFSFT